MRIQGRYLHRQVEAKIDRWPTGKWYDPPRGDLTGDARQMTQEVAGIGRHFPEATPAQSRTDAFEADAGEDRRCSDDQPQPAVAHLLLETTDSRHRISLDFDEEEP